jgi:hypothetical protein
MKVFIEIEGGVLVFITTDTADVEFVVKDWDNYKDPAIPYESKVVSAAEMQALITKNQPRQIAIVPDENPEDETPEP